MCWQFEEKVFSVNQLFTDAFRYDAGVNICQLLICYSTFKYYLNSQKTGFPVIAYELFGLWTNHLTTLRQNFPIRENSTAKDSSTDQMT